MCFFKKNKVSSFLGKVAIMLAMVGMLTGCGDGNAAAGNAAAGNAAAGNEMVKYLMYQEEGDAKNGDYIHVTGLNLECDATGKLLVNLDDIVTKFNGKIEIPEKIDGLPVLKVSFDEFELELALGGTVAEVNGVSLRTVLSTGKFYRNDLHTYYDHINYLILPEGLKEIKLRTLSELKDLKIPVSAESVSLCRRINGKLTISDKEASKDFASNCWADRNWNELEVFRTDFSDKEYTCELRAGSKGKKVFLPDNFKKIKINDIFDYCNDDGCYKVVNKGFSITCASDAEVFLESALNTDAILKKLSDGDVFVNGKDLKLIGLKIKEKD